MAEKKLARKQPNRVQVYINETVGELRKVNWPTRQEAINLTTIVIIVIFTMAIFLALLDLAFAQFFQLIVS